MATATKAPSDFASSAPVIERAPTYIEREGAVRSACPTELSPLAYVTRGQHAKSGERVLLHVDGSARNAMAVRVIAAAIAGGSIAADDLAVVLAGTPAAAKLVKLLTPSGA